MTANEILDELIKGVEDGIQACYQRSNASTRNLDLAGILAHIKNGALAAQLEIMKGNVK